METKSRSAKDYDIEVITSNTVTPMSRSGNNDTLLYFVSNAEHPLVISSRENQFPFVAILDGQNGSLIDAINNPDENNVGMLATLDVALTDPEAFNESLLKTAPTIDNSGTGALWNNIIVSEVDPKVKVEWSQWTPFNNCCPHKDKGDGNKPAGCVAIAAAQACTVTRHFTSFYGLTMDWDRIVNNLYSSFVYNYDPETIDIVAKFIYKIGLLVDMDYGDDGSGADTKTMIEKIFTSYYQMQCDTDKKNIEKTLKNHSEGIVIISSRTKSNFLFIPRGIGHCYIADGFKKYEGGRALIHVNYGQGYGNGYYLQNLLSPSFTDDASWQYAHNWNFYCLYKK